MNTPTSLPEDIVEKVRLLEKKYSAMGQNLRSYLDGLLYADYITYWEYVHLDVLLSLQTPRTPFKDEVIFIIYHQITELYFKLILHATQQIADNEKLTVEEMLIQLKRMNSYFRALINSFEIMVDGMDREQFLQFRMSLLPASGFQSAQYRMIELCSTDLDNLIVYHYREKITPYDSIEIKYKYLYWKRGATELATGKKTLTLQQFEKKYQDDFLKLCKEYETKNLWQKYKSLTETEQQNEELIKELKQYDLNANVYWPLMHYKSAVRYLQKDTADIAATGGTNWQKYLPPKNQYISFYPELWKEEELRNWGKKIQREVFGK